MTPRVLAKLLLLSLTLGAPAALAQAAAEDRPIQSSGVAFSLRGGFGLPLGLVDGGGVNGPLELNDVASGIVPVQLDVGYFLGSSVYLSGSFQYARVLLAADCPAGESCSASDLRLGINASFHLPVSDGRWSPWLGAGVGYEIFKPGSTAFKGLEFSGQAGADYHLSGPVWAGPFALFTTGKFSDVTEERSHYWISGGLRLLMRH